MIQTLALFHAAYRELNARKLFWITMLISGLLVGAFAAVGLNETGMTVLWWEFELPLLNSSVMPPDMFYKLLFALFGVPYWLAWLATILALISTAPIMPDMVSGGSIDILLSKPIGRTRLFLTRYFTGLLFVAVQVSVFTVASFFPDWITRRRLGTVDSHRDSASPYFLFISLFGVRVGRSLDALDDRGVARDDPLLAIYLWRKCSGIDYSRGQDRNRTIA